MKKRCYALLAVLALLTAALFPTGAALGAARYPALRGAVNDDANALSQTTIDDLTALHERVEDETGVKLYVAIVHFLDGEEPQAYANELFKRWELGEDDFLLLGAAGEDDFASVSGEALRQRFSDSNARNLLFASGFGERFKTQQYDAAVGAYFISLTDVLNKQYSAKIELDELFSAYQPTAVAAATPSPSQAQSMAASAVDAGSAIWSSVMDAVNSGVADYTQYHERRQTETETLKPTGWIVMLVIIVIIFGRKKPGKGKHKHGRG